MTNADKIRKMTDEELAEFLMKTVGATGDNLFYCDKEHYCYGCEKCYLAWLQKEVE